MVEHAPPVPAGPLAQRRAQANLLAANPASAPVRVPAAAPLAAPPPLAAPVAAPPAPAPTVNLNVTATPIVIHAATGPHIIVRALWFWALGWWLGTFTLIVSYAAFLTVVGMPLTFALVNRLPQIVTLRPRSAHYGARLENGAMHVGQGHLPQAAWPIGGHFADRTGHRVTGALPRQG